MNRTDLAYMLARDARTRRALAARKSDRAATAVCRSLANPDRRLSAVEINELLAVVTL